jgi:chitin biosynthesis protein CHS5
LKLQATLIECITNIVMSKSSTTVQFTVGKLDAGMAILLTQDHHQIEFPSILLPKTVTTGSIIDLSVTQNPDQEAKVLSAFLSLQNTIREAFASKSPRRPVLTLRNATQTSAVLEWEPIDIATAELKSLTLWRDATRLGNIPKPLVTTTTKLSGLAIDTDYTFQLVLRTTAGTYYSEPLKVRTHKLSNLSGITVCAGTLPSDQLERLTSAIEAIGAKPLQKRVRIDTTHFVCSVPEGDEFQRAKEMNVPIVVVDWIEACQREGKIVGVRAYYLDADPALRPKGSIPQRPQEQERVQSPRGRPSGGDKVKEPAPTEPAPTDPVPTSADAIAAIDQENERVLHTAEEVAPAVDVVPESTAVPAPITVPEIIEPAAPEDTLESKSETQPDEVKETGDPEKTEESTEASGAEEKFDDIPI